MKETQRRKEEHLKICLEQDVASSENAGWDAIALPHKALPELDFKQVSLEHVFLGQSLKSPFLISSMTGGSSEGEALNDLLATFAEARGLAMGVGSQRIALENRTAKLFSLRQKAPKAVLYANLGLVQLNYGVRAEDCAWLVDQLEAQALILHANVLQESIQSEGNRNFSGLFAKIKDLKKNIQVPLILKETGCGLDVESCLRARDAGVDAVDIAGRGGTHWGYIEGLRSPARAQLGELFRNWGWATPVALKEARKALGPGYPIIASGGLRHGLDAARAFSLGADLCGLALPFLKKAKEGGLDALNDFLNELEEALKIALFCMGICRLEELKDR